MRELPKVHVAVVHIPNSDDPESIATAAASCAMELLVKVSAENRGAVSIDRVGIVKTESVRDDLVSSLIGVNSRHAVMVTCRVRDPKPEKADVQPESPAAAPTTEAAS